MHGMVEAGTLTLDDLVSKHLPYWTKDDTDPRASITLRHLLSQTSGFGGSDTVCQFNYTMTGAECAEKLYEESYGLIAGSHPDLDLTTVKPGSHFHYCEAHWTIMAHAAVLASGQTWRELFTRHVGGPTGVTEACQYANGLPTDNIDTGAMLFCSMTDFYKILRSYFNGELVSAAHMKDMESAETMKQGAVTPAYMKKNAAVYGSTVPLQYGLGCWRVCFKDDCSGPVLVKSHGYDGVYPFIGKFQSWLGLFVCLIWEHTRAYTHTYINIHTHTHAHMRTHRRPSRRQQRALGRHLPRGRSYVG
jgi:CubicO group peptidase (beta-lactamase class C family)